MIDHLDAARQHRSAGRLTEAAAAWRRALKQDPANAEAHRGLGEIALQDGEAAQAIAHLEAAANATPTDPALQFQVANLLLASGQAQRAADRYQMAAVLAPQVPEVFNNLGAALKQLSALDAATTALRRAIELRPAFAEAWNTLGTVQSDQGTAQAAAESFLRAVELKPSLIAARVNLGHALCDAGDAPAAVRVFHDAVARQPGNAAALNGLGIALQQDNRHAEAAEAFARALKADAGFTDALGNLAVSVQAQGDHARALSLCRDALDQRPDDPTLLVNLGHILQALGRQGEAADTFTRALHARPDLKGINAYLLHARLHLCQWDGLDRLIAQVLREAEDETSTLPPFALLGTPASPVLQARVAQRSARTQERDVARLREQLAFRDAVREPGRPLHVGYVSPDFRGHSVGIAFRDLLNAHDRTRFRWHGYATRRDDSDDAAAFSRAFDVFRDISALAPGDAARLIHEDGIDVLIDLAGHTRDSRIDLFALRPAPAQAHYLGYGSTVGAVDIPWLITDPVHTTPEIAAACSEAMVYLPDTFMAASRAEIDSAPVSRTSQKLPEHSIVFVNFNAFYKFHPDAFAVWMDILRDVPDSVLWLREGPVVAMRNLRHAAEQAGVAPHRLVFAPREMHAKHLARLALADLGLDTTFHAGGVTTLDALWAGVPVVTLAGASHPARTGASILHAMGMPELVAPTLDDYRNIAKRLGTDAAARKDVRARLASRRLAAPLFQPLRLARHLEQAFTRMAERQRSGQPPAAFRIDPIKS